MAGTGRRLSSEKDCPLRKCRVPADGTERIRRDGRDFGVLCETFPGETAAMSLKLDVSLVRPAAIGAI
jgi:hypothetical protein